MKRRIFALFLAFALVLSMSVTVFAEPGGSPIPPGLTPIPTSIPLELSEAPSDSYSDDTIANTNMANIVE